MQIKKRVMRLNLADLPMYCTGDRDFYYVLPLVWHHGMPQLGPISDSVRVVEDWQDSENELLVPRAVPDPTDGIVSAEYRIIEGFVEFLDGRGHMVVYYDQTGGAQAQYRGRLPEQLPHITDPNRAIISATMAFIPVSAGAEIILHAVIKGFHEADFEALEEAFPGFSEDVRAWTQLVAINGQAQVALFDGRRAVDPGESELTVKPWYTVDWDQADAIALGGLADSTGWGD